MQIDESERLALIACKALRSGKEPFTEAKIADIAGRVLVEKKIEDIPAVLARLEVKGLLLKAIDGEGYVFSDEGLESAKGCDREYAQKYFGEWMIASESSPAYAEFCRRVYGTDLIQFNMVDAEQLERLMEFLDLRPGDRIADLGCGIGTQAEYISDRTGACVVGLDFSRAAIARASARTAAKGDRLQFEVGDLDAINLPRRSFQAAAVFDTLYFVEDLAKTVSDIAALMVPGGRLGIFYSEDKKQGDPDDRLSAEGTRLAGALRPLGLEYQAIDYSKNERRIWTAALAAATELRPLFEAEGNLELWKSRDEESRAILSKYESGSAARYLYLARSPA